MRNRIFDIVVLVLLIGQGHEYALRYLEWDTLDFVMLFCFSYVFFYLISRHQYSGHFLSSDAAIFSELLVEG